MNISGFELAHPAHSVYCANGFCGSIIPLCFAGVSPDCARNRTSSSWYHFSFGEHVCEECVRFLGTKSNISFWQRRLNAWQKTWMHKSSSTARAGPPPPVTQFLADQLLPWWLKCCKCGCWRQLPPGTPIADPNSEFHPSRFQCDSIRKAFKSSCSWPLDERSTLVTTKPQDFLTSMELHAWPQSSPGSKTLAAYGIDLVGLSAEVAPGWPDQTDQNMGHSLTACFMFKLDGTGLFSPIDVQSWERVCFPEMARLPLVYLAVRNMILCLWSANPACMLTPWLVSSHFYLRGLLRIVLCDHWIPRMLEEFTQRGLINIGACRLTDPLNNADAPTTNESANAKPTIHILGQNDLQTALMSKHLSNVLSIRERCASTRAFRIQRHILALDSQDYPLSEIKLNVEPGEHLQCSVELWFGGSVHSEFAESRPLVLPRHNGSDRVYLYDNHSLTALAKQTNLTLIPVTPCVLFYRDPATSQLVVVPEEKRVRIEFHVEAVLDMVSQLNDPDSVSFDEASWLSCSVQETWDHFNDEIRCRLHDLDGSKLEQSLIEFFLASVEWDLTEPLTVNTAGHRNCSPSRTCPTACLDHLPTKCYAEFVSEPSETPANAAWCPPHRVVNNDVSRGVYGHLIHHLLDQETSYLNGAGHVILRVEQSGNCNEGATDGQDPHQGTKVFVKVRDEDETPVDWVIVSRPVRTINLIFDDQACVDLPECAESLCIQLPSNLRPLLTQNLDPLLENKSPPTSFPTHPDPARIITVTLVYSTPWWRAFLPEDADPVDFAFLPHDRSQRGFCHVLRDMFPQIQSPGVLQTQVFANAANLNWSKLDNELVSLVDTHLRQSIFGSEASPGDINLLASHVARLEHRPATEDRCLLVFGEKQCSDVPPEAWDLLAKYCHILIPSKISSTKMDEIRSAVSADVAEMDSLTSALSSGIRLAQVALRYIHPCDALRTALPLQNDADAAVVESDQPSPQPMDDTPLNPIPREPSSASLTDVASSC